MKIKMPSSLTLNKLLNNKKFTVPFSIILSFVIWLVVMINQNPVREQVFTDITATISLENTALGDMGIGIVSDISSQKFTVTVSGPNYIVSSVKPEDFLITASLADVNSAGTYTLDITGARNSNKSGYTFSSISPATLDVTFDYIDVKEFSVVPKAVGVKAADGLVVDTAVLAQTENNIITIKGPRTVLDNVNSVTAVATVNDTLNATTTYNADIILADKKDKTIYNYSADGKIYDANGNTVESTPLTLSYTSVKVIQPIFKKASFKIKPVFTNLPSGLNADAVVKSVDHATVNAIGTPDVIDKISEILLSAIDFRNVSLSSGTFEVSAVLPDGVKLLDNIELFTVTVDTSKYAEKIFTVSELKFTGLGSSLTVKSSDKIKNVKICGPANAIKNITADDIYGTVDLTDKVAGDYTVDVNLKSDKYTDVWQVGNYSTTVKLADK